MRKWIMRLLGREAPPLPPELDAAAQATEEASLAAAAYWKARGIRREDEARLRAIDDRVDRIRAVRAEKHQ